MERTPSEVVLDERRAFKRAPDGSIVVRRAFGADAAALALSVIGPVVYLALITGLLALLFWALPEGGAR